jgi:hypothetical protein
MEEKHIIEKVNEFTVMRDELESGLESARVGHGRLAELAFSLAVSAKLQVEEVG